MYLGPLIRITPNELSFYSLETYDLVHKVGSRFAKDPRVYGEFVQDNQPALFSITQVSIPLAERLPLTDALALKVMPRNIPNAADSWDSSLIGAKYQTWRT